MSLPLLAVLGSTAETQYLQQEFLNGKLAIDCRQVASLSSGPAKTFFIHQQRFQDLDFDRDAKIIMGEDNIVTSNQLESYYQSALPYTPFVLKSDLKLIQQKDWSHIKILKHRPLSVEDTSKFEVLRILQGLRAFSSAEVLVDRVIKSDCLAAYSLQILGKLGATPLEILIRPSSDLNESWVFTSKQQTVEVMPLSMDCIKTSVLQAEPIKYYSYHKETKALDRLSVWNMIFSAPKSLENLTPNDWEFIHHV